LKGWDDFFMKQIKMEKDISRNNPKISRAVTDSLKYEYFLDEGERPELLQHANLGLFSHDRIMCYIFVFDYNNERSFEDVLEIANYIKRAEKTKMENDPNTIETIKCFMANKYPYFLSEINKTGIDDYDPDIIRNLERQKEKMLQGFYASDEEARKIKERIERLKYFEDG
jgi:hypothetical protein